MTPQLMVRIHLPQPLVLISSSSTRMGEDKAQTVTAIETLTNATSTIVTMVGNVFDLIVSNPLLTVFAAGSLLGIGISFFKHMKRAAR